jgi:hypothetical protein
MATQAKPRPSDDEALFLIHMRRQRARAVLNDILHGFASIGLKMPTIEQMHDYLSNTIQYLEMMLKLLSGDWSSHNVGRMFQTITGQAHPNPALMAALQAATMDQKYLMSPAAGIVDHIPELEYMGDFLYERLSQKYGKFMVHLDQDLPDNLVQFLIERARYFYRMEPVRIPPGSDMPAVMAEMQKIHNERVDHIRSNLKMFLSLGNKLRVCSAKGQALV